MTENPDGVTAFLAFSPLVQLSRPAATRSR